MTDQPARCGRRVGSSPSWMSEDQWETDGCACLLPPSHQGKCGCEHTAWDAAEVGRLLTELDENEQLRDRLAGLLRDTANALKGLPGPLESHDWSDLPKVAADIVAERDQLLLFRDRLVVSEGYDSNRDCLVIYVDRAAATNEGQS